MSARPPDAAGVRHRDQADSVGQAAMPAARPRRRRRRRPIPPFRARTRPVRHPFALPLWDGQVIHPPRPRTVHQAVHAAAREERRAARTVEGTRRQRIASLRRDHPELTRSQLAALDRARRALRRGRSTGR